MITLDADKYRISKKDVEFFLMDKKTDKERFEHIGMVAVATGVPIIVVCGYIGELYGFNPELLSFIQRLKTFYQVDRVDNIKEYPDGI